MDFIKIKAEAFQKIWLRKCKKIAPNRHRKNVCITYI